MTYRDITGQPGYRVGGDGSIWTCWTKGPGAHLSETWKPMKARIDHEGYRRVTFRDGTSHKVCALVLAAFVGPCPPGMECCHGPAGNADDSLANLRYGTHLENIADKRTHGTMAVGDRHGKTKLSESQLADLLALKGHVTQKVAADRYGVSRGYVGQLWAGTRKRVVA